VKIEILHVVILIDLCCCILYVGYVKIVRWFCSFLLALRRTTLGFSRHCELHGKPNTEDYEVVHTFNVDTKPRKTSWK